MQFSQATQPLTRPMGARLNSPILHLPFQSLKRAKARAPERGFPTRIGWIRAERLKCSKPVPFSGRCGLQIRAPERGIHAASSPMILSDVESLVRAYGVRFLT